MVYYVPGFSNALDEAASPVAMATGGAVAAPQTYYYIPGGSGSLSKATAPAGANLVRLSPYISDADRAYIARANTAATLSSRLGTASPATDANLQSIVSRNTAPTSAPIVAGLPGTFSPVTPLYNRYPMEKMDPNSVEFEKGYGDRQYLPFMTNQGKSAVYEPDKLDPYNRSGVYLDPNAQYRITDRAGGGELYSGTGEDALKNVFALSQKLSAQKGNLADWGVETYDPATKAWKLAAEDKPNFDWQAAIPGMALPVAAAFIPGLGTLGSILAATAAGGAGAGISGNNILQGALMGGLGAAGGSLLGPALQGAGVAGKTVSTALGTGLGTTAGGLATGKSLKDALIGGALSGAGSYLGGSLLGGKSPSGTSGTVPEWVTAAGNTPLIGGAAGNIGSSLGGAAGSSLGSGLDDAITVIANKLGGNLGSNLGSALGSAAGLGIDAGTWAAIQNAAAGQPTQQPAPQPETAYPWEEILVNANRGVVPDWLKTLGGPLALGAGAAALGGVGGTAAGTTTAATAPSGGASTGGTSTGSIDPATGGIVVTAPAKAGVTLPSWVLNTAPLAVGGLTAAQIGAGLQPPSKPGVADYLKTGARVANLISKLTGGGGLQAGANGVVPGGLNGLSGTFGASLPSANMPGLGVARTAADLGGMDWNRYGYGPEQSFFTSIPKGAANTSTAFTGYAEGGEVAHGEPRTGYAVGGPGDGRDDKIPAVLSDGEYVMDAETVAMLGNGSNKAGAKALDAFRVNIRKHKGQKLAKGDFSANAKKPEQYMKKGRP